MLARADKHASVVSLVGSEENDFQVTAEEVIDSIDEETRAIFLLNPSNPTYVYYPDSFFEKIIPVLASKDIYLIIDESGDAFYMGDHGERLKRFPSIIGSDNVIRIVTASKKYLLAEYRIGYVLGGKGFMGNKINGFIRLIGDDIGNAPLAANEAWYQVVKHELLYLKGERCTEKGCDFETVSVDNNAHMDRLRSAVTDKLKRSNNIDHIIVTNTNFNICFKVIGSRYKSDKELYKDLLDKTHVSILPCSGLGIPSEMMYFRLTYGLCEKDIEKGLDIFLNFIKK